MLPDIVWRKLVHRMYPHLARFAPVARRQCYHPAGSPSRPFGAALGPVGYRPLDSALVRHARFQPVRTHSSLHRIGINGLKMLGGGFLLLTFPTWWGVAVVGAVLSHRLGRRLLRLAFRLQYPLQRMPPPIQPRVSNPSLRWWCRHHLERASRANQARLAMHLHRVLNHHHRSPIRQTLGEFLPGGTRLGTARVWWSTWVIRSHLLCQTTCCSAGSFLTRRPYLVASCLTLLLALWVWL